jgi:excisionase family DNA binding protein
MTTKLLLTVEEAADRLGVGRTLMYALIRSGDVPSVQIGRLRRVRPADLEACAARLAATLPTAA